MIQEIIVAIIGILVLGILLRRIYLFFFRDNKVGNACECSGCHYNTVKK